MKTNIKIKREALLTFLNNLENNIQITFSYVNKISESRTLTTVNIPLNKQDGFTEVRKDLANVIKSSQGNKSAKIQKYKYVTFTLKDDNQKNAISRLEEVIDKFSIAMSKSGIYVKFLDGKKRLELTRDVLNIGSRITQEVDWTLISKRGLKPQDIVSPKSLVNTTPETLDIQGNTVKSYSLTISGESISEEGFNDLLDTNHEQVVTITLKKIDTQFIRKRAVDNKYAMQTIKQLQTDNSSLLCCSFTLTFSGKTEQEVSKKIDDYKVMADNANMILQPLPYQQESALFDSACLGCEQLSLRYVYTTPEILSLVGYENKKTKDKGTYFGTNYNNGTPVLIDRDSLRSRCGLYIGYDGKSGYYSVNREIVQDFLCTDKNIVIIDSGDNFKTLTQELDGESVMLGENVLFNPLKASMDTPFMKELFIKSMCEEVMGGNFVLSSEDEQYISQTIFEAMEYEAASLESVINIFSESNNIDFKKLAQACEIRLDGVIDIFSEEQLPVVDNRVLRISLGSLSSYLKRFEMIVWMNIINTLIEKGILQGNNLYVYIDDIHLLTRGIYTPKYMNYFWDTLKSLDSKITGIIRNPSDANQNSNCEKLIVDSGFIHLTGSPCAVNNIQEEFRLQTSQMRFLSQLKTDGTKSVIITENQQICCIDNIAKNTLLNRLLDL